MWRRDRSALGSEWAQNGRAPPQLLHVCTCRDSQRKLLATGGDKGHAPTVSLHFSILTKLCDLSGHRGHPVPASKRRSVMSFLLKPSLQLLYSLMEHLYHMLVLQLYKPLQLYCGACEALGILEHKWYISCVHGAMAHQW